MKKIISIGITIIMIFVIYWFTLDKDVNYLALGDAITVGVTDSGISKENYVNYVEKYLESEKILENSVNIYAKDGYRITDMIRDIEYNQKLVINNRNKSMKNLLIKADLVTISINNEDVINKLTTNRELNNLYNWIDELCKDYERLLGLLRDYCKEEIIVIGYYYPNVEGEQSRIIQAIKYLNNSFKEISFNYNINYINLFELFDDGEQLVGKYYPTNIGYKKIGEQVIFEFNKRQ